MQGKNELSKIVRELSKEFEKENKDLYSEKDYYQARRIYLRWKFGNYQPRTIRGKGEGT